jgi:hypothetical protein
MKVWTDEKEAVSVPKSDLMNPKKRKRTKDLWFLRPMQLPTKKQWLVN